MNPIKKWVEKLVDQRVSRAVAEIDTLLLKNYHSRLLWEKGHDDYHERLDRRLQLQFEHHVKHAEQVNIYLAGFTAVLDKKL